MQNIIENLNENQREAVLHTEGPLLILAGAGSGKTRVITHRIAHLIAKGVKPWNIFAVTFTNKACEEMKKRVIDIVGPGGNSVFIKTFHSASVYILRRFGEEIGIPQNFTIYDTSDQEDVIKQILIDLKIDHKKIKPSMVASRISALKDSDKFLEGEDIMNILPDYFSFNFSEVFNKYQEALAKNNALDFNDLLIKTVYLLRHSSKALTQMQSMWHYFMIDEYQDTNYAQYLIAKYLASKTKNICVVGDDDQSIYSWRGADIRNILNFEKDYSNARVITLEENYRSTSEILEAAYHVIRNNENRKDKKVRSFRGAGEKIILCKTNNEYGEGEFVINTIVTLKKQENLKNKDFAIFYRTNAQSRIFEDFLRKENLPYRIVGGLKFYERKEIKDILAYLKFIVNTNDTVSLHRIINVPARGIGKATIDRIAELAYSMNISQWTVIRDNLLTGRVPKGIEDFATIIQKLKNQAMDVPHRIKLSDFIKTIIDLTGYRESLIEENTLESRARLDNIEELLNSVYDYQEHNPEATAEAFLQDISLYTSEENPSGEEDKSNCITLMTVHNAKGLEFPVVFLTGMEEDTFPHKLCVDTEAALEEERRLCYVGITRAMNRLYITTAQLRRSYAGMEYKTPSRFLSEIPKNFIILKEHNDSNFFEGRGSSFNQRDAFFDGTPSFNEKNHTFAKTTVLKRESHKQEDSNGSAFTIRERVLHPKYGTGRIVKIEGSGDNIKLTISFGVTTKVFMEKYTPLQKLN